MTVQRFYPISQEVAAIQVNTIQDIHEVAPEAWIRTRYNDEGTVDEFGIIIRGTGGLSERKIKPGQWLVVFNDGVVRVLDEEYLLEAYRRCPE